MECSGGAVKEFVPLILFFVVLFLQCSVLITADHTGNTDAKTEAFLGTWFTWCCSYEK